MPRARGLFFCHDDTSPPAVAVNQARGVVSEDVTVLGPDDVTRALTRISHEIIERNEDIEDLVIVGLQTGGTWIADCLVDTIARLSGGRVPVAGSIDVSMYRDDMSIRPVVPASPTDIPCDLTGRTVILVDDVLYTGRTVRAALEALNDHGRPRCVRLVVMVDRGHRELPIRPDYVGKNLPTRLDDEVSVSRDGVQVRSVGGRE